MCEGGGHLKLGSGSEVTGVSWVFRKNREVNGRGRVDGDSCKRPSYSGWGEDLSCSPLEEGRGVKNSS